MSPAPQPPLVPNGRGRQTEFPRWALYNVQEIRPGYVQVDDIVVTGTFTGEPYQPRPTLQPLQANGTKIKLDPERMYFTLDDQGKITEMEVVALGGTTGRVGVYVLAGGSYGQTHH